MGVRRWTMALVAVTVLVLAALGTGVLLAAPWAQQTSRPEEAASESASSQGFLGVAVHTLDEGARAKLDAPEGTAGVVIVWVLPGGPAAEAGLLTRDLITEVDGEPVVDAAALKQAVAAREQGDSLSLSVLRASEELTISVALGAFSAWPGLSRGAPDLPKIVDGEFRAMKGDTLVTVRIAVGTVVAVDGDTLTLEKPTPDGERVSFTVSGEAKVTNNGKAVELGALMGEQAAVYEEDVVVKRVQAGRLCPGYGKRHAYWFPAPGGPSAGAFKMPGFFRGQMEGGMFGGRDFFWAVPRQRMDEVMESVQRRLQELQKRAGFPEGTSASPAAQAA